MLFEGREIYHMNVRTIQLKLNILLSTCTVPKTMSRAFKSSIVQTIQDYNDIERVEGMGATVPVFGAFLNNCNAIWRKRNMG